MDPNLDLDLDLDLEAASRAVGVTKNQIRYWKRGLERAGALQSRFEGNKELFTPQDVERFKRIKAYISEGMTAAQAIRLITNQETPEDLRASLQAANRQIQVLQRKVVQLRRPRLWRRLIGWFRRVLRWS